MAKIKIKLNSKRSTTIRATDGAYYKLRAGENIIELEQDAYSALISALGLKPNNKKQKDPKPVTEPAVEQKAVDIPKEQPADNESPAVEQSDTEHVEELAVEQPIVEEQPVCTDASESCEQITDDVISESDNTDDDDDDDADDDTDDQFSQMTYSQLKAAYKEITGKSSKLKRNELINFLREHNNAE